MIRLLCVFPLALSFAAAQGSITGTVVDPNGAPVPGVVVRLLEPVDQKAVYQTRSGPLGVFAIEAVRPQAYFFTAKGLGFEEYTDAVTVTAGTMADLGSITLRVGFVEDILLEPAPGSRAATTAARPNSEGARANLRNVHGSQVLTVCEYLSFRAKEPLSFSESVIVIGILVESPEGSWLQQSCHDALRSGDYTWPNAIALEETTGSKRIAGPFNWADYVRDLNRPPEADMDPRDRNGRWAAFIGRLETRTKFVALPCGDGKLCANGYGAVSAPARLIYKQSHEFAAQRQ